MLAGRPASGLLEVAEVTPQLGQQGTERAAPGDGIPPAAPADPPPAAALARRDLSRLASPERAQTVHPPHRRGRFMRLKAVYRRIEGTHAER